ncbi:MAG: hypothetical protein ABI222_15800 [Opitutaceae bacterium]
MSWEFRVLRFARVPDGPPSSPEGVVRIANVLIHEPPVPAGSIIMQGGAWHYLLADGSPSGLTSTMSRPDLEQQIVLYHFGVLPAVEGADPAFSLAG